MDCDFDKTQKNMRVRAETGEYRIGDKLVRGRYEICSILGRGGMGIVYRCYDKMTRKDVVLKTLLPEMLSSHEEMEELRRNFAIAGNLSHPNIATMRTIEEENSRYFLVMDYVEGIDLRKWIQTHTRNNHINVKEFFSLMRQVAAALDYAHKQGVIHRDIKPENIMISSAGEAKVLDFGIAIQNFSDNIELNDRSSCGTVHYIAPELVLPTGKNKITPALDQYSFAVTVFFCLFGKYPIENADHDFSAAKINFPITASITERTVFQKALSIDPDKRFSCCTDFINALGYKKTLISYWKQAAIACFALLFIIMLLIFSFSSKTEKIPLQNLSEQSAANRKKMSPRLLIRTREKIRNIRLDSSQISQGLLQQLALSYGFQTINPEYKSAGHDFVIDLCFSGAYQLETMSFNKNIKLHLFSLGADISATYPNGNLISQITLPSKDYRIGRISDPQEALRSAMHKRLAAEDETSFRNILLDIIQKWNDELKDGRIVTIEFKDCADLNTRIENDILEPLKSRNIFREIRFCGQDKEGNITWDVKTNLAGNTVANLITALAQKSVKIDCLEYNRLIFRQQ